jgi:hypothetical protein
MIGGISSISSIMPALNPVIAARPASTLSSGSAGTAASETPSAAPPPATVHTDSASAHRTRGDGGEAGTASTASVSTVEQMIGVYSTTVGGQQFAGTVADSNGVYTVSVPNIPGPGATASGTSEMAAENNLDTVIDELV